MEYTEDYNEREKYYIKKFQSLSSENGYNILSGGENPPLGSHATLSKEDVKNIQNMLLNGKTITFVHNMYPSVTRGQITKINNGSSWFDENLQYPLNKDKEFFIGDKVLNNVIYDLQNTFLPQRQIAKKYNISRTCVTAINLGKNYHDPDKKYPLRTSMCVGSICDDPKVVSEIIEYLQYSNESQSSIAKKYDISASLIHDINIGKGRYFRENLTYPIRKTK